MQGQYFYQTKYVKMSLQILLAAFYYILSFECQPVGAGGGVQTGVQLGWQLSSALTSGCPAEPRHSDRCSSGSSSRPAACKLPSGGAGPGAGGGGGLLRGLQLGMLGQGECATHTAVTPTRSHVDDALLARHAL